MSSHQECESRDLCDDVRDRLTAAEAEIERLRKALRTIKEIGEGKTRLPLLAWRAAYAALEPDDLPETHGRD